MNQLKLIEVIGLLALLATVAVYVSADPTGTSITWNVTQTPNASQPANKTDAGGTITTMTLSAIQQNTQWKAYVGNISGSLVLNDQAANSIFQWTLPASSTTGKIFASRAFNVTWSTINCSNLTIVQSDENAIGMNDSAVDSVKNTFNESVHPSFMVAGRPIQASSCNTTATWVNNTKQAQASSYFPEMLLGDGTNLVYTTLIRKSAAGFDTRVVDFQMILADNPTSASTTYYFYAELGS